MNNGALGCTHPFVHINGLWGLHLCLKVYLTDIWTSKGTGYCWGPLKYSKKTETPWALRWPWRAARRNCIIGRLQPAEESSRRRRKRVVTKQGYGGGCIGRRPRDIRPVQQGVVCSGRFFPRSVGPWLAFSWKSGPPPSEWNWARGFLFFLIYGWGGRVWPRVT